MSKRLTLKQKIECKKLEFQNRNKIHWTVADMTEHVKSGCPTSEKQKKAFANMRDASKVALNTISNPGNFGSRGNIRERGPPTLARPETSRVGLLEEIDNELANSQSGAGRKLYFTTKLFKLKHLNNLAGHEPSQGRSALQ